MKGCRCNLTNSKEVVCLTKLSSVFLTAVNSCLTDSKVVG